MDESRNKALTPADLAHVAKVDFAEKNLPTELDFDDALSIVRSMDNIADNVRSQAVAVSAEALYPYGCVLGYAFCTIFNEYGACWEYVDQWERWAIRIENARGEHMHLNVFNKLEKRFENGDVDSLDYYMQGIAVTIEGEVM